MELISFDANSSAPKDSGNRIDRINTIRSNNPGERLIVNRDTMMQLLAPASLETKINWAKDVEKFESRLNTGLQNALAGQFDTHDDSISMSAAKQTS